MSVKSRILHWLGKPISIDDLVLTVVVPIGLTLIFLSVFS